MSDVITSEEYKKEYDKAAAELDAAANATTAEVKPVIVEEVKDEPKPESITPEKSEMELMKERLERAEKMAKDNQAWATKAAQEAAALRREREAQQRAASRPAILDDNPELADAIRYVASDPTKANQEAEARSNFHEIVNTAHPGIFDVSIDPELEKSLMVRLGALGDQAQDPLVVIREITEEKLLHAERQIGKRFAAESAKQSKISAMSVPGAGGGASRTSIDSDLEAVQRIQKMSDADFAKEVRRAKGLI